MKYKEIKPIKPEVMEGPSPMSGGYRPNISIPITALPEAKDWDVGDTYEVALKIKMTGIHMHKGRSGEEGAAQFDITGVAVIEEKTPRYGTKKE